MIRPRLVLSAVADITRLFTVALFLPFSAAFLYEPFDASFLGLFDLPRNALVFLATALIMTLFWLPTRYLTRRVDDEDLQEREAYITVGVGWLVLTVFATLPFLLSGTLRSPVDAFFEAMSGLTTTGATVIPVLDDVPRSILLWRSLMQYLGGMGIIVLSIALLARLTHGGIQLLQAEAPGPSVTRIRPKLAQTAKTLWLVYSVLSLVFIALLFLLLTLHSGMGAGEAIWESVNHVFTGLSTAGFSTHSASIAWFHSWAVELMFILMMLIGASNFTLYYYLLHGDWRRLVRDAEWRFFMGSLVAVTLVITGLLWQAGQALAPALRDASFTVTSLLTSTGYSTADFDAWPDAARLLLLILMITGGTAGSTAGGVKHVRILILLKIVRRQMRLLLHPRAVIPIRLGGRTLKEETLQTVVGFFFAFLTLVIIGAILLITTDPAVDLVTGVSAATSMMGNTGPALGAVGPSLGYWDLLASSKIFLAFLMWFGRLEIFAALILFFPGSWKK